MNHNLLISYETLHFSVLAFIMTCLAIPVGGMLYSWIVKRFQPERIVVPDWDFSPERDSITLLSDEDWTMMTTDQPRPYDWAQWNRKHSLPYNWEEETD